VRLSPLGAVHTSDKDRVIVDFSAPHRRGQSLNGALHDDWTTVQYSSFRDRVAMAVAIGKDGLLWSIDAKDAYLQLKVRPDQRHFLAVEWANVVFVFAVMMLGLASAPRIYTLFADVVMWIVMAAAPALWASADTPLLIHYLDDFFGGHQDRAQAFRQFALIKETWDKLNIPWKASKAIPPAPIAKILGLLFDLPAQAIRLPSEKAKKYLDHCARISAQPRVSKRDLLSLAGRLRHASVAIFGGAAFVRNIEAEAHRSRELFHSRRVTAALRCDLDFWMSALPTLSQGVPFDYYLRHPDAGDVLVTSDASGTIGMGGSATSGEFFAIRWSTIWPRCRELDIYFGEALGIAVLPHLLRHDWLGKSVTLFTDNANAEWAFRRKRCADGRTDISTLIKHVCLSANTHQFRFWIDRITTDENTIADGLSRFKSFSAASQPARFGKHPLSTPIPRHTVRQAVQEILGPLWSKDRPPCTARLTHC
jgi:hypothetical protein